MTLLSRSAATLAVAAFNSIAPATQPPGRNAWEELRTGSEAHAILKRRCQTDAGEEILATREGVKSIYLESELHTMAFISGGPSSYGITYTHPTVMFLRNGLYHIEYSSALPGLTFFTFGLKDEKQRAHPYVRFDTRTQKTESISSRSAAVRISFRRTTSEAEEKVGVFGRIVEIFDDATQTLLARRRDYVWLNPNPRGAHGGFMCPTVPEGEQIPISLLAKAINVQNYTCWTSFARARRELVNKHDSAAHNVLLDELNRCQAEYFQRTR